MSKKILIFLAVVIVAFIAVTIRQVFCVKNCLLPLSQSELAIYESYIKDYNDTILVDKNPILSVKLYLNAVNFHDAQTCYALFNKDLEYNYLLPTKDQFIDEYMFFEDDVTNSFKNCKSLAVFFDDDNVHATVTWSCKVVNKSTNKKQEINYSFRLIKNKLNIWKVAYQPLQVK
ncbi:hypothetical protein IMX26_12465 [Clostridium sp. 'deep sea']|uniref:hypothetical protein n=1 Tax=Clostridium sp. 'deep sea' TaxID=2779445 RepID=UPI00189663BF|nr:hypothetical protein [Clostridium sp. 'deep sea']QOR34298.1 hypothetical protein IMX26_12465 [Clostridium sp. 'deep sea']